LNRQQLKVVEKLQQLHTSLIKHSYRSKTTKKSPWSFLQWKKSDNNIETNEETIRGIYLHGTVGML